MSSHFKGCPLSPEYAHSLYFQKEHKAYDLLHERELMTDLAPVAKQPGLKGKPNTTELQKECRCKMTPSDMGQRLAQPSSEELLQEMGTNADMTRTGRDRETLER